MSLAQSKTALGLAVIFVASAAVRGTAQTQTVAVSSPTTVATNAAPTGDPKKEGGEKSIALPEKNKSDKASEPSRDQGDSATDTVGNTSAAGTAGPNAQSAAADDWRFSFSPYFWAAGLHGTTGTSTRTVDFDQNFSEIFDVLNFAFMSVFEARKGKFSIVSDLEYVSVEDTRATPGPLFSDATAKVKIFILAPQVGYRIFHNPEKGAFVDVEGGIRIWHLSTDFTFGPGILPGTQVEASRSWVDGIIGLRGKMALSQRVFITGKFGLGGGGSNFTYQLFAGLGYNITPKIALVGGYRVLDVNYNKDNFVYDTNQRGPILGAGFRF